MSINEIEGKSFCFSKSILSIDPFEGCQLVVNQHGVPCKSVTSSTDYLVVSDDIAAGSTSKKYVEEAKAKGASILAESQFLDMADFHQSPAGTADHWIIIDDYLEDGKADVSNAPAWDNTVAPYKLFIQHGSVKTTDDGGWNIVGCGLIDPVGYSAPNVISNGNITGMVPWSKWSNDIGSVIVKDAYAPKSCAFLFDGLSRCSSIDLSGMDTSNATSMVAMFRGCASIDYFMTTDRFKTNNVTDMSGAFFGCISARVINCIGWDLAKVESMASMFENSPAAVLFDESNVPIPQYVKQDGMFDSTPIGGRWMRRA
jgi:hypothetical protein